MWAYQFCLTIRLRFSAKSYVFIPAPLQNLRRAEGALEESGQ